MFPGHGCASPHSPLPRWAQNTLERCATEYPALIARACAEALGYSAATDLALLRNLRDNENVDVLARIFAGRALTRLTGIPEVSADSLDRLGTMAGAQ